MFSLSISLYNADVVRSVLCLLPILTTHNIQDKYNSDNEKHPKLWVKFFLSWRI